MRTLSIQERHAVGGGTVLNLPTNPATEILQQLTLPRRRAGAVHMLAAPARPGGPCCCNGNTTAIG